MQTIKEIFTQKKYVFLFWIVAISLLYLLIWLNSLPVITSFFALVSGFWSKVAFLFSLITTLGTNFTVFSIITTLIIVLLFSLNITMMAYYIRYRRTHSSQIIFGKGFAGFIAGLFGMGCSACGAAVLGPLLAALGVGGLLTILPFHGQEFTLIGIILLVISLWSLNKKMKNTVCEIEEA
ncbi:hypothetical protein H6776_01785 [Candidatus Nomurabacteria bacterium]|nr:hypothetical protein [Candidatus Nomurabacteria bacterium]